MIVKTEVEIRPFNCLRRLHIYLPTDYEENSERRYPVIYMYDGHNLFEDEEATYGKSWGLKDYLDYHDFPLIVVGIECNHDGNERLSEFSPYSFTDKYWGKIRGKGKRLMTWVVNELKPMIDSEFRTLPDRRHTAVGGSSMGGLMSLYTIAAHNDVFSRAACLSPHCLYIASRLYRDLDRAYDPDTKAYISWGSEEHNSRIFLLKSTKWNTEASNRLVNGGAQTYLNFVLGGQHTEACWESETDLFIHYLFDDIVE